MKNVACVLAMVVAASVVGCRDTDSVTNFLPITNPSPAMTPSTAKPMDILPVDFVVPLRGVLLTPGTGTEGLVEVDGQITIRMNEIPVESVMCPWVRFALVLHTNGSLRPLGIKEPVWEVRGRSSDEVLFEVQGHLDKTYVLQGRSDGMTLHVRLLITREDVTLDGMSLELLPKVVVGSR